MNIRSIGGWAAAVLLSGAAAFAQDVKEKAPRYTYVSNFSFPRAHWGEVEKQNALDRKTYEAAIADGTLSAYGTDEEVVHSPEGYTHDSFFSASSFAGLLKVLSRFTTSRDVTEMPVLASATKHEDMIFVSRFYNGRAGAWKDVYTYEQMFRLKADAPDESVEKLSASLIAPLMEKLLGDGTILQYEIDTEAVHKHSPDNFYVFYIAPNAESLDKARAARSEMIRSSPLLLQAFGSVTDSGMHRDDLLLTTATYK